MAQIRTLSSHLHKCVNTTDWGVTIHVHNHKTSLIIYVMNIHVPKYESDMQYGVHPRTGRLRAIQTPLAGLRGTHKMVDSACLQQTLANPM
jgi:hypothetical protein